MNHPSSKKALDSCPLCSEKHSPAMMYAHLILQHGHLPSKAKKEVKYPQPTPQPEGAKEGFTCLACGWKTNDDSRVWKHIQSCFAKGKFNLSSEPALQGQLPEWIEYAGDYNKRWYDIRLSTGREVLTCYPNAGTFTDGKNTYQGTLVSHIRECEDPTLQPPKSEPIELDGLKKRLEEIVIGISYSDNARFHPEGYVDKLVTSIERYIEGIIGTDDKQRWDEDHGFCDNCCFQPSDGTRNCICIFNNRLRAVQHKALRGVNDD